MKSAGSFRQAGRGRNASARALILLLAGLLTACGSQETEAPPNAAGADEKQALEDAAEMLEQQRRAPEPTPSGSPSPAPAAD